MGTDLTRSPDYIGVYDFAHDRFLFGPIAGSGGPPLVTDVDGDGYPEFAVSATDLRLFDLRCVGPKKPAFCSPYDGERWRHAIHDRSSGFLGASAFDLDGDGLPEILHRDECWLRALRGTDGVTRFAGMQGPKRPAAPARPPLRRYPVTEAAGGGYLATCVTT